MALGNTEPVNGDAPVIICLKWLQALRTQHGQTDADTSVSTNDSLGIVLNKILTVYSRV